MFCGLFFSNRKIIIKGPAEKTEVGNRKSEVRSRRKCFSGGSKVDQRWIKGGSKVDQINRRFSQSTLGNEFFNNKQQTTNNKQQTTNNKQQTTNNKQTTND
jgi:hypothetical protein